MFIKFVEPKGVSEYKPTTLEKAADTLIKIFSPRAAMQRARDRQMLWRYQTAMGNDVRRQATPQSSGGETQRGNRERMAMMWNAIELVENSGLASSIRQKIINYVCGTIRYQARTGDKVINSEYEAYLKARFGKAVDIKGEDTLRQLCGKGIGGQIVKGDFGLNLVRDGGRLFAQGIEADRIGNPYEYVATDNYVGGIELDQSRGGARAAYHIYRRERMSGQYVFDIRVPARTPTLGLPNFLFTYNRNTFDDVRGRTVFKSAIDDATYIEKLRQYELQALIWAASQSGVYTTNSGTLNNDFAFRDEAVIQPDGTGGLVTRFNVLPNTVTAMGMGENVTMFQHDRPSPNVVAMYKNTIQDIALGCNLSYGFVYSMSGLTGPAVRFHSSQDKRAIDAWKADLKDDILSQLTILFLMEGINDGVIPFHENFASHEWIFPSHPTIDVGRESVADINDNQAALRTGASIVGAEGEDIEEVQEQCGREAENLIEIAKRLAKKHGMEWQAALDLIRPGKKIIMSTEFEAARAEQQKAQADQLEDAKVSEGRASSDGVAMD